MTLLAELGDTTTKRSKSAHRLARHVVQDPESVLGMSIAALAAAVGVSEPTVNRFCTGLGFKGFPDFKVNLAAELGRRQPSVARDIDPGDSTSHVIAKVFESGRASLHAAEALLGADAVDQAVAILDGARSITLCGLGASASVALDAQHKLLRFGTPVIAHTDVINQRMTTASLRQDDCVICISYTGRTVAMVEVAALAARSGARVIGISEPDSPLAAHCELVLAVDSGEDTDLYTPMSSRLAQLGPAFAEHLRAVKHTLGDTRYHAVS
jgi:RpiR family carbohydrate utilization transcriptional regulator